ncbi:MAG: NAD(P)/FAD-dependent oxidoreductase [Chloroflexi bacterium]|nr:NAD(P)/FAD-dependent oxidoreductase [Chloroflexota bacterium]
MATYDVIVIGGGPVGSYIAGCLARHGHGVLVLEQREKLGAPVCCTGIISRECVADFGLDGLVLRPGNSAKVFAPSGKTLRLWRQEPPAYLIDRPALDAALAERAQQSGAKYVFGARVQNVAIDEEQVTVTTSREHDSLYLTGRVAVLASGFGSRLDGGLGLGKIGDFVMGVQAEVLTLGLQEVEVYFGRAVAPGFFAWLVPTTSGKGLAGLLARRGAAAYFRKLVTFLLAEGKIVSPEVTPLFRPIPLKPLPRTYGERLVVVGGAAGQVKPTTGGGIYYGLLCANIAVAVLHRALTVDDLSARSLAAYEHGWRRRLGRELRTGYWARRLFERLGDWQVAKIFDIISNGALDAWLQSPDLSFDWHSGVILKLLTERAVSRAFRAMKIPLTRK